MTTTKRPRRAAGTLRRKGNGYEVIVTVRDPATGRRRQISRSSQTWTARDAELELAKLLTKHGRGQADTDGTLGHLITEWLDTDTFHNLSPTTRDNYTRIARRIHQHLGDMRLDRLNPRDIDNLYRTLRRGGTGPSTIRTYHAVLSGILQLGVRWQWITTNPADVARPPAARPPDIRPPSPGEVAQALRIAEASKSPDLATFFLLSATVGARRGEIVALRWSDIDFDSGVIRIDENVVHTQGRLEVKDTKTHAERKVPVDALTMHVVGQHRSKVVERARAAGVEVDADGFVFSDDPRGLVPWKPNRLTRAWNRIRVRAGLPNVRLHDLRHFVGTQLADARLPMPVVSKRLGHSKTSTTSDIYAHPLSASEVEAGDEIARRLRGQNDGMGADR